MTRSVLLDDRRVQIALAKLNHQLSDKTELMAGIAGVLQGISEESFNNEQAPDGTPWAGLQESTLSQRKKLGYAPGPILQRNDGLEALSRSIQADWGEDFAQVGSNAIQAAVMFFGASEGEFGETSRGVPIPWGDIPGREYIGLSDEGANQILGLVDIHLNKALKTP